MGNQSFYSQFAPHVTQGLFHVGQALASAAATVSAAAFNLPTTAFETAVKWQKRDEMRRHLASLDQRLLDDAGLTPADVRQEINKPLWHS